MPAIIYTITDEAPALATQSLLPIIRALTGPCQVEVEGRDISLAGRIIANFPERLTVAQRIRDDLAELGQLVTRPEANIIKLPNVSASVPQLTAAIAELQAKGYDLPDYPHEPSTQAEREIKARYGKVLGSAVNPVLREGNSDRRAARAVKNYAMSHPHSMGTWSASSKSHVATMDSGDFRSNEKSMTVEQPSQLRIELVQADGEVTLLKDGMLVDAGEIVDATVLRIDALQEFIREQLADAKRRGVLFSLHLKATMMKVSDPIIFGHVVKVFFESVFEKYAAELQQAGANPADGLGQILSSLERLPAAQRAEIEAAFHASLASGPSLAMVDSDRGITNLHVPSDVIVDASMPAMIRSSGQMWNVEGKLQDTKAVIPDSSYAGIFQATIENCKKHGAFNPATMGTVPNVGLMAQQAEEYGSHDKTFAIPADGFVRVVDQANNLLFEHSVRAGDIWRMCLVKDEPVREWVKLAVARASLHNDGQGAPAVFWLDVDRPHDAQLIKKVRAYLRDHDTQELQIEIMPPVDAIRFTLDRVRQGLDTISVTGNVLRDYLTDLFPILELGTSAKMLSIVPLLKGGGLFETGAGGSAPKHVQQFVHENYLRWDSLGEFLALTVSLEYFAEQAGNPKAQILARALDWATEQVLTNSRSPARKIGSLDTRGSHFYLALYWAESLRDASYRRVSQLAVLEQEMACLYQPLADELGAREMAMVDQLNSVQGQPVDLGGYYWPDPQKVTKAMRPSTMFNDLIDRFAKQVRCGQTVE